MATIEESTAFRQFNYCSLCKLSHKVGKKHVYSKRHQQILQAITKKFSDKIQKVKKDLFSPVVQDENFERDAKFWCYFCKAEYLKHEIIENFTVVAGGLLEHIAGKDHKSNMDQFFWDNLLKKELNPKFLLSLEDLHIFKKAAFLAVKKRQKTEELARTKIAERIAFVERKRLSESAVTATSADYLQENNTGTSLGGSDVFRQGNINQSVTGRKKTVSARADGLTSIRQNLSDEDEGNVHSGAVPPWLQPDVETSHSDVIGPTMQDFQKHLEREKKSKLPANRVGARFDHTAKTSDDWLPSFGRVWSKGRRLQSKQHFEKELRKEQFGKFRQKQGTGALGSTSTVGSSVADYSLHSSDIHLNAHSNSVTCVTSDSKSEWTRADELVKPISSQARISVDEGRSVPDVTSDYRRPITCNPYKRKRDVTHSTDVSSTVSQRWSHTEVTYNCEPYKRHRSQTSNSSRDQIKLIQTPVLAMEERK